jgi:hypothetical protein
MQNRRPLENIPVADIMFFHPSIYIDRPCMHARRDACRRRSPHAAHAAVPACRHRSDPIQRRPFPFPGGRPLSRAVQQCVYVRAYICLHNFFFLEYVKDLYIIIIK